MYVLKLNETLFFVNKAKQKRSIYIHNKSKKCEKVKNEFCYSSDWWQRNLFTEVITELIVNFIEPFSCRIQFQNDVTEHV